MTPGPHLNRQQRRQLARDRGRSVVDPETGAVATSAGTAFRVPRRLAELPPKQPGRHRWILSSGYVVTPEEAHLAHEGVSAVLMGADRLLSYGIGCWDCEELYDTAVSRPCVPVPGPLR